MRAKMATLPAAGLLLLVVVVGPAVDPDELVESWALHMHRDLVAAGRC